MLGIKSRGKVYIQMDSAEYSEIVKNIKELVDAANAADSEVAAANAEYQSAQKAYIQNKGDAAAAQKAKTAEIKVDTAVKEANAKNEELEDVREVAIAKARSLHNADLEEIFKNMITENDKNINKAVMNRKKRENATARQNTKAEILKLSPEEEKTRKMLSSLSNDSLLKNKEPDENTKESKDYADELKQQAVNANKKDEHSDIVVSTEHLDDGEPTGTPTVKTNEPLFDPVEQLPKPQPKAQNLSEYLKNHIKDNHFKLKLNVVENADHTVSVTGINLLESIPTGTLGVFSTPKKFIGGRKTKRVRRSKSKRRSTNKARPRTRKAGSRKAGPRKAKR